MMRNDDAYDLRCKVGESLVNPGDLSFINPPALYCQRASSVDTEHGYFFVVIKRSQVVGDVMAIFSQWLCKAREDIVQRNIMIPRHDDLRPWQTIQKGARFGKLVRAGSLRQISGDRHQIRIEFSDCLNQRRDDMGVDASRMYIGEMDY